MTKLELRSMIREVLKEELSNKPLKENVTDRNFKNLLMKSFINSGDRDTAKLLHQHEFFSSDSIAPGTAMVNKSGTVGIHTSLLNPEQMDAAKNAVKKALAAAGSITEAISTKWDDLLDQANTLLDELCVKSGNASWDDGDGYWSGDREWCNRNIYYVRLANTAKLEKLCTIYSTKLPNVEFYFVDDDEAEVSEIGYTAAR